MLERSSSQNYHSDYPGPAGFASLQVALDMGASSRSLLLQPLLLFSSRFNPLLY